MNKQRDQNSQLIDQLGKLQQENIELKTKLDTQAFDIMFELREEIQTKYEEGNLKKIQKLIDNSLETNELKEKMKVEYSSLQTKINDAIQKQNENGNTDLS